MSEPTAGNGINGSVEFKVTFPGQAPASTQASLPEAAARRQAFRVGERAAVLAEAPSPKVADGVATLRIYDPLDSWGGPYGLSAKEFVKVIDELPDNTVEIRLLVNSPGGEVWEGLAILNALRGHQARTTAIVEGVAASAASFIAVGCDELVMAPNAELYVHKAWGLCVGNALDMQKMADDLEHEDRNLASIYAAKAGGDIDTWLAAMASETWYSAEEAVEAGLADRVGTARPASDEAKNRFDSAPFRARAQARRDREPRFASNLDLYPSTAADGAYAVFDFAGRRASAPAPTASASPPSPRPDPGQRGGSAMGLPKLRETLEVPEDITDDQLDDWLASEAGKPPPDPAPAAQLPEGTVAIDAATLEQLRTDAAAGVEARNEQLAQHRASVVAAAVADGRIAPARRDHWVAALEADPGAETVLASLAKGTVPVEAIGAAGAADLDVDSAIYAELFGKEATV